jgi:hypothetical protein
MGATITANVVVDAFDAMGGDPRSAVKSARSFPSISGWTAWQVTQAAVVGGIAMAIPVAHVPALVLDVALLIHKMAYCCWGIGSIHRCRVDGKDDIALIMAYWAKDLKETELSALISTGLVGTAITASGPAFVSTVAGMAASEFGTAAGIGLFSKVGLKGVAKPAGKAVGAVAGKAMSKAAAKIAAKIGAKFAVKGCMGLVPFVGPLVGAGVNGYFVKDIADAADFYYKTKKQQLK